MSGARAPRRYSSSIKRGAAAPAILAAASRLFAESGYAGTSIGDIAHTAGVARPTVFTAVGPKPAIFRAVLEAAVAGEEPVVPVPEQGWLRHVLSRPGQREVLLAYAHAIRRIGERISDLYWAAEVAAEQDASVRELWNDLEGARLGTGPSLVTALLALGPLRGGYDGARAAAVVTAVASPASWRALVGRAGWSPQQFEDWAGDTLCRTLVD